MTLYAALPFEPGLMSPTNLLKLQDLSLLSMGIFCHLRWYGEKSIEQLREISPIVPCPEIERAIEELVELGLLQVVGEEVCCE